MELDLETNAGKIGGEYQKLISSARNVFQEKVVPFKETKLLNKASGRLEIDPDQILRQAVKNDAPTQTAAIMSKLSPEGQKDFSAAILKKAVVSSTDNAGNLNLTAFATKVRKLGETVDSLPGDTKDMVKGLQQFITRGEHIIKASAASEGLGPIKLGVSIIASPVTKLVSSVMTNPTLLKQLTRLGSGDLNRKTADETIRFILKKLVVPSTASDIAVGTNPENE